MIQEDKLSSRKTSAMGGGEEEMQQRLPLEEKFQSAMSLGLQQCEPCGHCSSKKRPICAHSKHGSFQEHEPTTPRTPPPSLPCYVRSYSAPICSAPKPAMATFFRSKTDVSAWNWNPTPASKMNGSAVKSSRPCKRWRRVHRGLVEKGKEMVNGFEEERKKGGLVLFSGSTIETAGREEVKEVQGVEAAMEIGGGDGNGHAVEGAAAEEKPEERTTKEKVDTKEQERQQGSYEIRCACGKVYTWTTK